MAAKTPRVVALPRESLDLEVILLELALQQEQAEQEMDPALLEALSKVGETARFEREQAGYERLAA